MASHYYNEIDPYCTQWLQNLMNAGHIPAGDIDTRSIEDVRPDELRGYVQCHFFAGLGGWPCALALAGWPSDRPVWTGSCPCQPFSSAGKGAGFADERHLWPAFYHLIRECNPSVILGEQVASKDAEPWIDLVHADLEAVGYAFGCIPFPSAGVGAPHIRDRAYWCATNSDCERFSRRNRNGEFKEKDAPHAWRELTGIHAKSRWKAWLSQSGAGPIINGIPGRVGQTRAYGNAIVPQAAAAFVRSYMEARGIVQIQEVA